jgi:hypothetical protein
MIGPDEVEVLVIGVGHIGRPQEISFPVPRILIQQAQMNEPWPL